MTTPQTNGTTATPSKPITPPVSKRMALDKLVKGKVEQPRRILLYGTEGIGKSTFAANAPAPIFLGPEDGTGQLDVTRFPKPLTWPDILEAVRTLTNDAHEFKTFVLDTVDAAEPLLWTHMCERDSQPGKPALRDIEDYGYGKGYQKALDEWRVLLSMLERLRAAKGMNVILLAHADKKLFKNPEGEDFDRYELKLNIKAGGLLKEWCDAVLFAKFETYAITDEKKRVRGVSSGARLVHTQRTAAYDAKNRYQLPESFPLSWADFDTLATAGPAAAGLREEIEAKAKQIGQLGGDAEKALEKTILETMAKAGDNAQSLAVINNRVSAKLAELSQKGS